MKQINNSKKKIRISEWMNKINKHKYNSKLNLCGEALWVESNINAGLLLNDFKTEMSCLCLIGNQIKSKK